MFVQELKVGSFRHLRDVHFGPFREPINPSELIVLAGPNGGGKSSVLELLSQALTSRLGWSFWTSRSVQNESYALKIGLSQIEIDEMVATDLASREPNPGLSAERIAADQASAIIENEKLATYLQRERAYWIELNRAEVPPEDKPQNDRALYFASQYYSGFAKKLGFFIRSERSYRPRGYQFGNLLNRARRLAANHFNSFSFHSTDQQYEEVYDFLIEQSYGHTHKLGEYQKLLMRGMAADVPVDPIIPYNQLLDRLLPGYSFIDVEEDNLTLRIKLPTGNIIQFQDLSSGEKEAFFILALFVRHGINDSIIVIDEPELHLHPELARKLLRALRTIQPQNQIWCATHSAEIIDEAGRERTYFLRASVDRTRSECTPATAERAELNILRDMYGYSGYVGISKKIIFSEGIGSSADRKTFTNLFLHKADEIKIIPTGGHQELYRVNAAVLSLLESDFARCEFYLIRDHDYLSSAAVEKHKSHAPNRLFVLDRHHIENYLLDEEIISRVLESIYQRQMSANQVRIEFVKIARKMSAAVLRDLVVSRFNELYQSEDCSIGKHSNNLELVDENGSVDEKIGAPLREALVARLVAVNSEVSARTSIVEGESIFNESAAALRAALTSDGWKTVFPGRPLLQQFSKDHGLGDWPALQNLVIEQFSKSPSAIPLELTTIFNQIAP